MEPFCATVRENGTPVSLGGALDEIWHYLQGFRAHEPYTLVRRSVPARTFGFGQNPGARLCSGSIQQVMDWVGDAVKAERPAV